MDVQDDIRCATWLGEFPAARHPRVPAQGPTIDYRDPRAINWRDHAHGPYNNLWAVMHRAFQASGIAPPLGRRGLYLLRHSAATGMLDRGAPFGTISNVLGHASMESTRIYAKVDLAGLRTVALSTAQVRP